MALDDHDRELLLSFVARVPDDIAFVIEAGGEYIEERLYELLQEAWRELTDQGVVGTIADHVGSGDFDDAIERHGLTGAQLRFKIALVEDGRETAQTQPRPTPRTLRRFLKRVDVPLGSLLAAIGAGEALKEIKEGLEVSLPDEN